MSLGVSYPVGRSTINWAYYRSYSRVTTGKWYTEVLCTQGNASDDFGVGVVADGHEDDPETFIGDLAGDCALFAGSGAVYEAGVTRTTLSGGFGDGDVVGIRLDLDAGTPTVEFRVNGGSWTTAVNLTSGVGYHLCAQGEADATNTLTLRKEADFTGSIPSGYSAWDRAVPTTWDHLCTQERDQHTISGDTITPDQSTDSRAYSFLMPFRSGTYQFEVSGRTSSAVSQQAVRFGFTTDWSGDNIPDESGQLGGTEHEEIVVTPHNHVVRQRAATVETMGGTAVGTDAAFSTYLGEIDTHLGLVRFSPDNGSTWTSWLPIGHSPERPRPVGYRFVACVGDSSSGTPSLTVDSWPTLAAVANSTNLGWYRGVNNSDHPDVTNGNEADFVNWEHAICPIALPDSGTTYMEFTITGSGAGNRWGVGLCTMAQVDITNSLNHTQGVALFENNDLRIDGVDTGDGLSQNDGCRVGLEWDADNEQVRVRIDNGTWTSWRSWTTHDGLDGIFAFGTATTFDIELHHQRGDMTDTIPAGAQMIDGS